MHICQDEVIAFMSLLTGGGVFIRWLRAKWHQRRCQHKCVCNHTGAPTDAPSVSKPQQVEQT